MATKKNTGEDPLVLGLLRQVVERLDNMDARIEGVAEDVKQVRAEVQAVDARVQAVDARVQAVDASLGTLRQDMEHVPAQQTAVLNEFAGLRGEARRELEDHRVRIERLEKPLSRKTGS